MTKTIKNFICITFLALLNNSTHPSSFALNNEVEGAHVAQAPEWENEIWGGHVATAPEWQNELAGPEQQHMLGTDSASRPPKRVILGADGHGIYHGASSHKQHMLGTDSASRPPKSIPGAHSAGIYKPADKGLPVSITGLKGEKGIYYPKAGLADVVPTGSYYKVVEFQGGGRPVPQKPMVAFATMPNPNYKGHMFPGAPAKDITLYGIQTAVDIPSSVLAPLSKYQKVSKIKAHPAPSRSSSTHIEIHDAQGRTGFYLPYSNVAYITNKHGKKLYYNNVKTFVLRPGLAPEYNQTPNQKNPKLVNFAFYITNPASPPRAGGVSPKTQLYGELTKKRPLISVQSTTGNTLGIYDPIQNTVKFKKITYTNITEYLGGGRTPPSESNPSLKPIATMNNPHHSKDSHLLGAQSSKITLYGQLASTPSKAQKQKLTERKKSLAAEHSDVMPSLALAPGIALPQ